MEVPRRSPRLSFTDRTAPRLETASSSYEIVDLSEDGLRIRTTSTPTAPRVTIGDVMRAVIHLPGDKTVEVAGRVLRVTAAEAAIKLEDGQDALAGAAPMGPATAPRIGLLW